jgi:hypothetical protein
LGLITGPLRGLNQRGEITNMGVGSPYDKKKKIPKPLFPLSPIIISLKKGSYQIILTNFYTFCHHCSLNMFFGWLLLDATIEN